MARKSEPDARKRLAARMIRLLTAGWTTDKVRSLSTEAILERLAGFGIDPSADAFVDQACHTSSHRSHARTRSSLVHRDSSCISERTMFGCAMSTRAFMARSISSTGVRSSKASSSTSWSRPAASFAQLSLARCCRVRAEHRGGGLHRGSSGKPMHRRNGRCEGVVKGLCMVSRRAQAQTDRCTAIRHGMGASPLARRVPGAHPRARRTAREEPYGARQARSPFLTLAPRQAICSLRPLGRHRPLGHRSESTNRMQRISYAHPSLRYPTA